tara:strand:+ start:2789 stop:3427 length:639 start_codon:yes stop_codon:yes gene_type:complete
MPNALNTDNNDWLHLAPYGDHPHTQGLQCFSRICANKIVTQFYSLKSRLKRTFVGLPIYIGHPDNDPITYQDSKAYGWVCSLQARHDGLWMRANWSTEGERLHSQNFYQYLSPFWKLKPSQDHDYYSPIELVSIGLTNMPNLKGARPMCSAANSFNLHLNTESQTLKLGSYKEPSKELFLNKVTQYMQTSGEDYLNAWNKMKQTHPELYQLL